MALHVRNGVGILQENVGLPNIGKVSSARKNVLGSSKKATVLADVKNTLYLKQNAQLGSASKKQVKETNKLLKPNVFGNKSNSVTKGTPNKKVAVATNQVFVDECNFSDEDCLHCMKEEDWLTNLPLPKEFSLSAHDIDKLCLDPTPKSRYGPPSPEFDIFKWHKENPLPSPNWSPKLRIQSLESLDDFYDDDDEIMPIYDI